LIIAILGAVFSIFIVVVVHELGHYFVARWLGVHVLRFSVGFGKVLWSKTNSAGTEFAISMLPLGGYVRMLGEAREEGFPEKMIPYSYNSQPVYVRMTIVLAGPIINFLLAIFLFWLVYLAGITHIKPVIGRVVPASIAEKAGLSSGEFIQSINSKPTPDWQSVLTHLINQVGDNKPIILIVSHPPFKETKTVKLRINQIEPDQIFKTLGIEPYYPGYSMTVGSVLKGGAAEQAGFITGDRIIAINQQPYDEMGQVLALIRKSPGKELTIQVLRRRKKLSLNVTVGTMEQNGSLVGYLGFRLLPKPWPPAMVSKKNYSLLTAWAPAFERTVSLVTLNAVVLWKMILQKISLQALGGPISILKTAGQASQQNWQVYVSFLAFLSVALGFINLLPIPGLDGGQFLFLFIEMLSGKAISPRVQQLGFILGFILLLFLIFRATLNDLVRLFS